ncbi:TetR/AcrR family transcriptional regulator [Nocardioides mangrovi]|uniref:TetR/AcrR family transcriptional regulator helix-turn-helix transcriptional regulator n=1 Tax=Nocardioides mangrovi TaxID=2874580 RepID=A0ABS7UI16_9ACTN|nr:TetR/AcrR family transcriptional regulator [Nocardioides mangrovi]MBZ5740489.1 TetR/AcrR family transcriptional regulator; helix-turn-helix transcriptional regulator [Nocardioides mangrovi]
MSDHVNAPRRYDGSRRRAAAERTREAILAAARDLFAEHGYTATSVQDVAARAGVSVDTVYTTVGRKPRLLLAVHDMALAEGPAPLPAEQRDYVRAVRAAGSAEEMLRTYATALGRLLPRTVPLALALREAGRTEPECAAQYQALSDRRAAHMRLLAADLRATGRLREDLGDDQVADLIWSLNSPEWFTLLAGRGYPPESYADLLADVLQRTLLADRPQAKA